MTVSPTARLGLELRGACCTRTLDASGLAQGGFVWVRYGAGAADGTGGAAELHRAVQQLLGRSSFGRFFTALYPTRQVRAAGAIQKQRVVQDLERPAPWRMSAGVASSL